MESRVYSLLKVDIRNLVRNEASIMKNLYCPPGELERLPYWQYELLISDIEEMFKKEKDEQENSDSAKMPRGVPTLRDIQSGKYTPKMPKMPSIPKIPSIK